MLQKEAVVPSGPLQLAAHGCHSPAVGQPCQVQRQLPHQREGLGTVVLPVVEAVFPHGHV